MNVATGSEAVAVGLHTSTLYRLLRMKFGNLQFLNFLRHLGIGHSVQSLLAQYGSPNTQPICHKSLIPSRMMFRSSRQL